MKAILLCLALAGCATGKDSLQVPLISVCALQPISQQGSVTVVRMHCEPEGEAI